jgi:monoamine oxidase
MSSENLIEFDNVSMMVAICSPWTSAHSQGVVFLSAGRYNPEPFEANPVPDESMRGTTMLNRRRLLRTTFLASLAPWVGACGAPRVEGPERLVITPGLQQADVATRLPTTTRPPNSEVNVLVVGVGAAGIAAARALQQEGLRVLLLEGRERIGGRVWTSDAWPDVPLDLGASWIQGSEGNPLSALTREFGIETVASDLTNQLAYDAAGNQLSDDEQDELESLYGEALAALEELRESLDEEETSDLSLQAALDEVLPGLGLDSEEEQALLAVFTAAVEHEYAADLAELSFWHWDDGGGFPGEDRIFPGGYSQLLTSLAAGLDVRLGHVVQRIAYDAQGVTISTNQGDFRAQQALVTLPLGVLKQGVVEFVPPLPAAKRAAIQGLGMGLLDKVYLRFPERFWPAEPDLLVVLPEQHGAWVEIVNGAKWTGAPILLGFNAGSYARQLEARTDQLIVADMMQTLQVLYGDNIPDPDAWQITRWAADPFAQGAYSYLAPGSSTATREALAAPVAGRLFFAGEATSSNYPATVHGAFLSGEREAARILRQR